MKLKTILMMFIVAFSSISCSNDDEENVMPVADSVVGTYNGTLDMTVAGNSQGSSEFSVVITKTSDTTVSMAIVNDEAAAGSAMSISRVEIDGITVADNGDSTYTLSKVVAENVFTATDTGSANQTVWTFKSFSGSVESGKLSLNMAAQPGAMPMPINMVFTGLK